MTVVRLEPEEVVLGATAGILRRVASLRDPSRRPQDSGGIDRWTAEVEGACAEYAVAKLTGTNWNAYQARPTKTPDCGPFHVRWTIHDDGCLILNADDPDAVFVLVTGRAPTFVIHGAIRSVDGREPRYWNPRARKPAFFVPAHALMPLTFGVMTDAL